MPAQREYCGDEPHGKHVAKVVASMPTSVGVRRTRCRCCQAVCGRWEAGPGRWRARGPRGATVVPSVLLVLAVASKLPRNLAQDVHPLGSDRVNKIELERAQKQPALLEDQPVGPIHGVAEDRGADCRVERGTMRCME